MHAFRTLIWRAPRPHKAQSRGQASEQILQSIPWCTSSQNKYNLSRQRPRCTQGRRARAHRGTRGKLRHIPPPPRNSLLHHSPPPSLRSHRLPRTSARGGACTEAEAWTACGGRRGQRGHSACSPSAKAGVNLSNTDKKGIGHKSTDVRQESTKQATRRGSQEHARQTNLSPPLAPSFDDDSLLNVRVCSLQAHM
jgi:hypothetical protein